MKKDTAIKLLAGVGFGAKADAARILGISRQALHNWPDPLPRKAEAKVRAALENKRKPPKNPEDVRALRTAVVDE